MIPDFLLQSVYWFDPTPTPESHLYIPLIVAFSVLIIGGLAIQLLISGNFRKIWLRYEWPALSVGIFGFIYLLARYEELPWLASRFTLALLILVFIIWTIIITFISARDLPKLVKEKNILDNYNKYLPRTKPKNR